VWWPDAGTGERKVTRLGNGNGPPRLGAMGPPAVVVYLPPVIMLVASLAHSRYTTANIAYCIPAKQLRLVIGLGLAPGGRDALGRTRDRRPRACHSRSREMPQPS